jgi:hypothetical protein
MKTRIWVGKAVIVALMWGASVKVQAQSADALIDKLVEKGILTVKEANELREETEKNFNNAYSVKSGMPEWVSAFKFNGDARVRYEGLYSDGTFVDSGRTNRFVDRNRFRYRLRLGATVTMFDNFEAGLKLTTADPVGNFGGNPISGNTTLQDNGSKKFVYIDQVYLKWSPLVGPDWTATLTLGKMENPFVLDDMVFDVDYTPEGAAIQLGYRINDQHSIKFNGGAYILDELAASSDDPYLLAAQLRWEALWTPKWSSSLGFAALTIQNGDRLTNSSIPNVNRGNTRNADGTLRYDYNPVVVDASVTYTVDSFPFYTGPFPIRIGGEYMYNVSAVSGANVNTDFEGWNAGITFGKSGKRRTWELSYTYKWLGADSWFEELPDDDFGAFYGQADSPRNSGLGAGYGGGTNAKGHVVRFAYSPTDSLTLSVKWYLADLIQPYPSIAGGTSKLHRLQVDGTLRF